MSTGILASATPFVNAFFAALSSNPDDLFDFYETDSTLIWDHESVSGSSAILDFLRSLPRMAFDQSRFQITAQSVPGSNSTLVVAAGPCAAGETEQGFHSVWMIESDARTQTALIRSHVFRLL
jgi:hypothetical protein